MAVKTTTFEGRQVEFTRRRYGASAIFTRVRVQHQGEWVSLGDPWPCITPPKAELRRDIELAILQHEADKTLPRPSPQPETP